MIDRKRIQRRIIFGLLPVIITIFAIGCSEQPQGYIFTLQQRDIIVASRQAGEFVGEVFDHADEAVKYLTNAALTPDYSTMLPQGWRDITTYDNNGNPLTPYYSFLNNYLDQKLYMLQIDRTPIPTAVRHPSSIEYSYYEIGSYQNRITSSFYGNISQVRRVNLGYADNLRNPDFVEGWYSIRRSLPFDYDIQVDIPGGGSGTFTQVIYLSATWSARIERYSTALNDHRARIVINGVYPMLDRAGAYQEPHVSVEFNIDRDGSGRGELYIGGEPVSRLMLSGRSFGFQGYFILYSENHSARYRL